MGAHISIPMYQRAIPQRYRLVGQKCKNCGKINFPPKAVCMYCCDSWDFTPVELSGKGSVYTYTIISGMSALPEYARQAKVQQQYIVAIIQLDEGPRIISQLVDISRENIRIGMKVEMVFRRIYEEEAVIRYGYKFKPVVESRVI